MSYLMTPEAVLKYGRPGETADQLAARVLDVMDELILEGKMTLPRDEWMDEAERRLFEGAHNTTVSVLV